MRVSVENHARGVTLDEMPDLEEKKEDEGHEVPVRRRRIGQSRGVSPALAIALVTAASAIAGLVLVLMKDNSIYSKPVDELVNNKQRFVGRTVRAEGNLVHGTIQRRDQPCEYRFSIEKNGVIVPVRYAQCVVPDTFRDVQGMDVGVTVEGALLADNSFEATSVLAKCPSKYEMKDRQQHGETSPHQLPQ